MRQEGEESKLDPSSNASVRSYRFSLERLGRLLSWSRELGSRNPKILLLGEDTGNCYQSAEQNQRVGAMYHRPRLL